jgi:hypothetical protein
MLITVLLVATAHLSVEPAPDSQYLARQSRNIALESANTFLIYCVMEGSAMSYCTARRQAAQAKVRELEEKLREAKADDRKQPLREALEQAIAELVGIGDCAD